MARLFSCRKCKRDNLLADEITWHSSRSYLCKECYRNYQREYMQRYTKTSIVKYKRKGYHLKRSYGITNEQFEQMLINQNNICLVCQKEFGVGRKPNLDHCHKSGKIRGIICNSCNRAFGLLGEDRENVQRLLDYLEPKIVSGEENVA